MTRLTTRTTEPPIVPPPLRCPDCDRQLTYVRSYVSGTKRHCEQWDLFDCAKKCAHFEYRHRTRRLRRLAPEDGQVLQRQ